MSMKQRRRKLKGSKERSTALRARWSYRDVWRSKGFVIALIGVVVLISIAVTKEVLRRFETSYEIERLEEDVARLSHRNTELRDLLAIMNTSSYQDKEARVKLNVQKTGEQVIIFQNRKTENAIVLPDSDTVQYIPLDSFESNPEKWFYFFWNKMSNITL